MTEAQVIQLERIIAEQNHADAIRLAAQHCGGCGTRLQADGECPYGCTEPLVSMDAEHIRHGQA